MRSSAWLLTSDSRRGVERPLRPRGAVFDPAGFLGDDFLDHTVERAALRAFPHETGGDASALLADITGVGFAFGHRMIIPSAREESLRMTLQTICYTLKHA